MVNDYFTYYLYKYRFSNIDKSIHGANSFCRVISDG